MYLPETRDITLKDISTLTFCSPFKYLGTFISFNLRDGFDIVMASTLNITYCKQQKQRAFYAILA